MTRSTLPAFRMLTVLTVASALALSGCAPANTQPGGTMTTPHTPEPFDGTRPAKTVFTDFLDTTDDIVQHSGAAFPQWNREDVAGYTGVACGVESREDGGQYRTNLDGGPVVDPDKSLQDMKSHWEAKGYTIGNIFTNMGGNTSGRQINATSPEGILVQFTPGKTRSSILVQSDCTLDPLVKETTTNSMPLGNTASESPTVGP